VPVVTPAQLLLAIAEQESLEMTCEVLGIDRETAVRLINGAVMALRKEPPAAPVAAPRVAPATPARLAPASKPPAAAARPGPPVKAEVAGRLLVYSDGAARGNPGPSGAGAVITDSTGRTVLARLGRFLGRQTNNVAEYQGLLLGLRHALELNAREIEVRADSQLMIRQLGGQYQVKHAGLKPLHAEALRLLRGFEKFSLRHIPREENGLADEMSNRAIDEEM
jgi:ribonuclease HI